MKMTNKKLTAKKVLAIVVLTVLGGVGLMALFYVIFFSSVIFTGNAIASWILSIFITVGIPLVLFVASEMRKKK